ncbi:unnamed protein product [Enterobius vermicularis]|uniref:ANTH domain-containing protein n=1 Tax=Enterobius vermicularis TaxID=51028 RepID=A0A0N4VAI4_ENTVE|nr:unnamed protein product [Enterobius vermicularis]
MNQLYVCCFEMLDQMDNLLRLPFIVFDLIEAPLEQKLVFNQVQCLLAPLAPVLVDVSVLYRYLLQLLFKLRQGITNETFKTQGDRFHSVYAKTKLFIEKASSFGYLRALVKVPSFPKPEPASELNVCQIIEAAEVSDVTAKSTAGMIVCLEDTLNAERPSLDFCNLHSLPHQNLSQSQRHEKQATEQTLIPLKLFQSLKSFSDANPKSPKLNHGRSEETERLKYELEELKVDFLTFFAAFPLLCYLTEVGLEGERPISV